MYELFSLCVLHMYVYIDEIYFLGCLTLLFLFILCINALNECTVFNFVDKIHRCYHLYMKSPAVHSKYTLKNWSLTLNIWMQTTYRQKIAVLINMYYLQNI